MSPSYMSTGTTDDATQPVDDLSESEYRTRLRELPPSAKLVAKVLEIDAPLSQGQLAEETLLPDRTVRYALNRLDESDIIDSRYSFRDARKRVYFLRVSAFPS